LVLRVTNWLTRLAKAKSIKVPTEAEPIIYVPIAQSKKDIKEAVEQKKIACGTLKQEARKRKLFWPNADHNPMKAMLTLSCDDYGSLVQLYTGHNFFNRHKALLN
jgi:hypothetical protein